MENVVKVLQICELRTIHLNRKLQNLASCFPFLSPNFHIYVSAEPLESYWLRKCVN